MPLLNEGSYTIDFSFFMVFCYNKPNNFYMDWGAKMIVRLLFIVLGKCLFFCHYVSWVANLFQKVEGLLYYVLLAHDLNSKHMFLG